MLVRDQIPPSTQDPVQRAREMFRGERDLTFYELWRDVRRPEEFHQQMEYLKNRMQLTNETIATVTLQLDDQERAAHYVNASVSSEIADLIDPSVSDVVSDPYDGSIRPVMRYVRPATGQVELDGATSYRDERLIVGEVTAIRIHSTDANYCGFYISGPDAVHLGDVNSDFEGRKGSVPKLTPSPGLSFDMDGQTILLSFDRPTTVMIWGLMFARAVYGRLAVLQTRAISEVLRVPTGLSLPGNVAWDFSLDGSNWSSGVDIVDSAGDPYVHRVGRNSLPFQMSLEGGEASAVISSGVNRPVRGKIDVPHWIFPETVRVYRDLNCWLVNEVKLTGSPMAMSSDGSEATMELSGETFESLYTVRRPNDAELEQSDPEFARLSAEHTSLTAAIAELDKMYRTRRNLARTGRRTVADLRKTAEAMLTMATTGNLRGANYPFDPFFISTSTPIRPIWASSAGMVYHTLPSTDRTDILRTREQWRELSDKGKRGHFRRISDWLISMAYELEVEFLAAKRDIDRHVSQRSRARKSKRDQVVTERMKELRSIESVSVRVPVNPEVFQRMLLDDAGELQEVVTTLELLADRAGVTLGSETRTQELVRFKSGQALLNAGKVDEFVAATRDLEQHFRNIGGLYRSLSNLSFVGESEGRVSTFLYSDKLATIQMAIPVDYLIRGAEMLYVRETPVAPLGKWTEAGVDYFVYSIALEIGQNAVSFRSRLVASDEVTELGVGFLRDGVFHDLSLENAGVVISPHLPARAVDYDAYKHYVEDRRRFEIVGVKNHYDGDAGGWLTDIWVQPPNGHSTPETSIFMEYAYRDDIPTAIRSTDESFYLRTTLVSEPDRPARIPRMHVGYRL